MHKFSLDSWRILGEQDAGGAVPLWWVQCRNQPLVYLRYSRLFCHLPKYCVVLRFISKFRLTDESRKFLDLKTRCKYNVYAKYRAILRGKEYMRRTWNIFGEVGLEWRQGVRERRNLLIRGSHTKKVEAYCSARRFSTCRRKHKGKENFKRIGKSA